jgi:nucleotide-binding universal stress UspA family protein
MIQIKRVLCPVDFSECSRRALDHATALARWYEARLAILHVSPLGPTALGFPPSVNPATFEAIEPEVLRAELLRFAQTAAGQVPADAVVRQGDAARVILDEAASTAADLLVLGTHGRHGFERWVLGSVTEKVLRRAPCPVLTVPPLAAGAEPSGPPYRRILCPVDFSASSDEALRYALSLAEEAKARLAVLHVIEWFAEQGRREHRPFNPALQQLLEDDARARLATAIPAEARAWCEPEERVRCGKPYRVILREAEDERSDVIVLGVHGRGAIDRMLFGSTTNQVVRQATCPVLTVRHQ